MHKYSVAKTPAYSCIQTVILYNLRLFSYHPPSGYKYFLALAQLVYYDGISL